VPIDSIQAASDLMAMKQSGYVKVAVANDKEAYGAGLATLLGVEKGMYGVNVVSDTGIDPAAANFRSYAQTIKSEGRTASSSPAPCPTGPSRSRRT
jgi:branched-chain amino acid transport system substrate-binding protein